ncbi:hypothetical protein MUP37_03110 [Candidatus Bathyarchaeota archaeon]|nr:hypothetical protein [Candidatus Bathyarchaeota archaeon]
MARFLVSWHLNTASWPMDLQKSLEMNETLWAVMDDLMKKGLVKDYGVFPDGESGYLVAEGQATDVFMSVNMFIPYVSCEVHEIIPFEKQKEIVRTLLSAAIAAMKK